MEQVHLPRMVQVRQFFDASFIQEPQRVLEEELERKGRLCGDLTGKRVAVTVGSRGIPHLAQLVRTTVDWLKAQGAQPFIVPAMGSHGGA